jgi:hypothetical protein
MGDLTENLYARPSLIEGTGRIMDFSDSMSEYNTSESPEEADFTGALADWWAVARYLRQSFVLERLRQVDQPRLNL